MARLVAVGLAGIIVGMLGGAACGIHARDEVDDFQLSEETVRLAERFSLDPLELHAAANTVGTNAAGYLRAEGLLEPVPTVSVVTRGRDWIDNLLECLARYESGGNPNAVNRRSGASGWLQFLPSTFRGTPQGRAGANIFDVSAQRAAGRWMIEQGRLREWVTWRSCA